MAKFSTLEHSKTLENLSSSIFSTLASTLAFCPSPIMLTSAYAQQRSDEGRFDLCSYEAHITFFARGAEGCCSTLEGSKRP